MPGIDRTAIIQGPARILFGGQKFWSKGDVIVKPVQKRFGIESSHFGKLEERNTDLRLEVTFEPAGQYTNELSAVLWPYGATLAGASLYGSSDSALVINGRDGVKLTVHNAAVTKMPTLRFGVNKTTVGSITITGLLTKDTEPSGAAAYYTWASEAYPGDTGFSVAEIWTANVAASWGVLGFFANMFTESGWDIEFPMRLSEVPVDGYGTVDMRMIGVDCMISAVPANAVAADVMTALQGTLAMGAAAATEAFAIGGGGAGSPAFAAAAAKLVDADVGWGVGRKRVGRCQWMAVRTFSAYSAGPPAVEAAMLPLFTIAEDT